MLKNLFMASAIAMTLSCLSGCKSSQEKIDNLPAKEQWSKTYDGADETVPQYPDLYSHYWEYIWSVAENPNMVLRVHGAYPHCRYFSISLYNDADGSAINGKSDYEIIPDLDSVNPFVETSDQENYYTVYIIPASATDDQVDLFDSQNIIRVNDTVKVANIMIRQYMSEGDEYGGVDMPSIQAFDLKSMKEVRTPDRLKSNVFTNVPPLVPRPWDVYDDVPFMLASHGSFYPNNATDYLYARTRLEDDQVLVIPFVPVPMPQTVEEYAEAKARYWSICVGSCVDTRSYYSTNYEQAKVPAGEQATFVICTKQNPRLESIEQRIKEENANGKNWRIIVWDRTKLSYNARQQGTDETVGNVINVLYRNILPLKSWESSISLMTPTPYGNVYETAYADKEHKVASCAVGEFGPHGTKYSNLQFLEK